MFSLVVASLVVARSAGATPSLVFSAGFTSDAVLQRAPASAAVYGLAFPANAGAPPTVLVSLLRADGSVAASAPASVGPHQGAGSACDAECYGAGYVCAVGQASCCSAPSCPMGCLMAAATASAAACVAECRAAKGQCSYTIPGTQTDLDMCGDCLPNCPGCPDFETQCEAGCAFGHGAAAPPLSWKALLPPQPAGGEFTLIANCTAGCAGAGAPIAAPRVTYGDVFYASGQSNLALGMRYSLQHGEAVAAIRAGAYSNIRFFQYGGMGSQIDGAEPAWATTVATAPMWPWQNLSAALNATGAAAFDAFSAAAFHFAASLSDLRGDGVPIGVITNAVGGTTIEAWSSREMLAQCRNTSTGNGAAPVTALFYGMVAPFVNTTIAAWLYWQGERFTDERGSLAPFSSPPSQPSRAPRRRKQLRRRRRARELCSGHRIRVLAGNTGPRVPRAVVGSAGHDDAAGALWHLLAAQRLQRGLGPQHGRHPLVPDCQFRHRTQPRSSQCMGDATL